MKNIKRDNQLDVLRAVGLLGIILAHVSPPNIIMQLRTFDVPLMVIVSGISYAISCKKKSIILFYKRRILRLLAPTWSFLFIFFLYFYGIEMITGNKYFSIANVINSFLLLNTGGIGYVWIIRVFILVAISTPVINIFNNKVNDNTIYFFLILICMFAYLVIAKFVVKEFFLEPNLLSIILIDYLLYVIPYSLIFATGLRLRQLTNTSLILLLVALTLIFILLIIFKSELSFFNINSYKYPPQELWISYGLLMSVFFYLLAKIVKLNNNVIYFMSSSSIWIYLWHIFLLINWSYCINYIPVIFNNFIVKFFIITSLALFFTYMQKLILSHIIKFNMPSIIKKYVEISFLK